MFTGIVQAIGRVILINRLQDDSMKLSIDCSDLGSDFSIGESININGVCLTIEDNSNTQLSFTAVKETLDKTNLKYLKENSLVNLERAATLNTLLGGHLVTGHVDSTSKVVKIEDSSNWKIIEFQIDDSFKKYLIAKGSIAINGVSLTISDIKSNSFMVNLIPLTLKETNLKQLKIDDYVNIEFDLIGKYVLNKTSGVN
jgi:riboflavin synthase